MTSSSFINKSSPKIAPHRNKSPADNNGLNKSSNNIHEALYELAKCNPSKDKVDKSTLEVEYEKSKKECTFRPTCIAADLNATLYNKSSLNTLNMTDSKSSS